MDLALSENQVMLKQSASDFLRKECPKTLIRELEADERGHSPELWGKMAALGWMSLPFPAEYGGIGGSLLDLAVIMEEMGRAAYQSPFFSTVVMAGLAILKSGSEDKKREFLPLIANGQQIMTVALVEGSGGYDPETVEMTATGKGRQYILSGTKMFVNYARVADYLLTVVRTSEGITLLLVPSNSPGISYTLLRTIGGDKQYEVTFDNVAVAKSNTLGQPGRGWSIIEEVLPSATVLQCAQMVGIAQEALDMTVDYVKSRVQFGRPIGQFQAVQHHCSDRAMDVDGARLTTYQAVWKLGEGLPARREIAIAKVFTSDAAREVTLTAHQLFGGIGFMKEFDLHFYSRQAKALELTLGTPQEHLRVVGEEMGL